MLVFTGRTNYTLRTVRVDGKRKISVCTATVSGLMGLYHMETIMEHVVAVGQSLLFL